MKKTLVLFRHGEAGPSSDRDDHGRKLTAHGTAQAEKSFSALANINLGPTFFIVSDAVRTLETFATGRSFFKDPTFVKDSRLYLAGIEAMRLIASDIDQLSSYQTIVFVGHNPGLSLALATLAGDLTGLSTADIAVLNVDAEDWSEALSMDGCWDVCALIRG